MCVIILLYYVPPLPNSNSRNILIKYPPFFPCGGMKSLIFLTYYNTTICFYCRFCILHYSWKGGERFVICYLCLNIKLSFDEN